MLDNSLCHALITELSPIISIQWHTYQDRDRELLLQVIVMYISETPFMFTIVVGEKKIRYLH